MFKTIEEYENKLRLLRLEKEGYLKAADNVDNNIKLLEVERDRLARSIAANEEFAASAKEAAHQTKVLVDSFLAEGFDEGAAMKMTLYILGAYIGKDHATTTDSIVGTIGGLQYDI